MKEEHKKIYQVNLRYAHAPSHITKFTQVGELPAKLMFNDNIVSALTLGQPCVIVVFDEEDDNKIIVTSENRHTSEMTVLPLSFVYLYIRRYNEGNPITEVCLGKPTSTGVATPYFPEDGAGDIEKIIYYTSQKEEQEKESVRELLENNQALSLELVAVRREKAEIQFKFVLLMAAMQKITKIAFGVNTEIMEENK